MSIAVVLSLLVFFLLGVPIAISIIIASLIGMEFFTHLPILVMAQRLLVGLDSFPLLAIPFFILAGNIMAAGGISQRLVDMAKSIVGGFQGGLAMSCVVTCMLFAAVSGSSIATTFAIGSILIPAMIKHGYPTPLAASIQATSAELGVLIPPSIPLILFGVSTGTSIGQLFIAGIGPGLLIAFSLLVFVYVLCKIKGYGKDDKAGNIGFVSAFKRAWAALLMPIIVIGGIYGGIFTPTEASAVAVFFSLVVGSLVYKELTVAKLWAVLKDSALSSAMVMLIIAAAALFSFLLSKSGAPVMLTEWAAATFSDKYTFLLAINIMLFIIGMFVETASAILVLAPILTPIAIYYGVDPAHFGLIVVTNLALGMITPPLGVNLFAACTVARISIDKMLPSLIQFVIVIWLCLMAITYFPSVTLFFRDLVY